MDSLRYYTTIGAIQELLDHTWNEKGRMIHFENAVKELYRENRLTRMDPGSADYAGWNDGRPSTLLQIHQANSIDVTDIIDRPGIYTTILPEDLSFFDKDVWALMLLQHELLHMHSSAGFEIVYVMEGSCIITIESESRLLDSGSFCIISPGVSHDTSAVDESVVLDIVIKKSTLETAFSAILGMDSILADFFKNYLYGSMQNYLLFMAPMTPVIANLIRAIMTESASVKAYSREICNQYMGILLAEIVRESTAEYSHYLSKRSTSIQMPLIMTYIRDNYTDISLIQVADYFGYDADYIGKLIHKSTGMYFNDIVNKYKTDRAADLLRYTGKPLSEIAELSGFNSVDHFSKTFKKAKGITPGRYRKQ